MMSPCAALPWLLAAPLTGLRIGQTNAEGLGVESAGLASSSRGQWQVLSGVYEDRFGLSHLNFGLL